MSVDSMRDVPPNLITTDCERITPQLLPLVQLSQEEIDRVVASVPGGVRNVQDIYALAPLQAGMLFHYLMSQEGDPYALWAFMSFSDRARLDAYVGALNAVIARHDILRTGVMWEGLSEPVQVVWRHATVQVEEVVLEPDAGDVAEQLRERFHPRRCRVDVRRAPMIRLYVARDPARERWVGLQLCHHLIAGSATLTGEVEAYLEGRAGELPEVWPYRRFIAQMRQRVARGEHEAFFRQMLWDVEEPTTPFGLLQVYGDGEGIVEARCKLEPIFSRRLRKCARERKVSAASVFHVAWGQVLARASGQDEPVFGTVVPGLMYGSDGAERVMGPVVNTLPVRIRLSNASVERCVRETHRQLAQVLRHMHALLAEVQRYSQVPAGAPLFTALLNYRHVESAERAQGMSLAGQDVEYLAGEVRTNYPLALAVSDLGDDFELTAQVDSGVGAQRVCAMMRVALEQLVSALESRPNERISKLEVLPVEERERLLVQWNQTGTVCLQERCIHELFEEQVRKAPEAIALICEGQHLSYGELNRRSNQLAHHLRTVGVAPDQCVAICMERSVEMVVGLLGVLKAGGAYVPLDPSYPAERLRYVLSDSAPVAVLSHAPARALLEEALEGQLPAPPIIDLDADVSLWSHGSGEDQRPVELGLSSRHLAYVIYTSGSTGQPKGVMVEHREVANFLTSIQRDLALQTSDCLLAVTTISFDIAALEIFLPLAHGAKVVLASRAVAADAQPLMAMIREHAVTVMQATPATWQLLLEGGGGFQLRMKALCGGESLTTALSGRLIGRVEELWNLYGPTETTIWSCSRKVSAVAENGIPVETIGRPIANTRIYILDRHYRPVPIGVVGEIYIGGAGVARGYLNRPDLTAERFIASPYVEGDRLYKTGDLARYLVDGNIEYLGRNDFQVKIRGFRIELGEIESRLLEHSAVREAVVLAREDKPGDRRLVAYYTVAAGAEVSAKELKRHLARTLANYMVPAAYVQLSALPLTPNGKLDRRGLRAPDGQAYATREYEAPQGEVEVAVAEIWSELLGVKQVGRHDNFFELGGHSLTAITLSVKIAHRMNLNLSVISVFRNPTVSEMGKVIMESMSVHDELAISNNVDFEEGVI